MTGDRLDKALVTRGLVRSRTEAQTLITEGQIVVGEAVVTKPSWIVDDTVQITIQGERLAYVSRGGLKLEAALDHFAVSVKDRTALDVGASTGGWTDCLLQRGIRHVLALDVGHNQMVASIADNPRVDSREGVNARFLSPNDLPTPFDLIVADLSFISLTLVLSSLAPLLAKDGDMILLVKPQFEVGVTGLGKGGIVRNENVRREAVERVSAAAQILGMREVGRMDSPILGANGNHEYLLRLRAGTPDASVE